MKSKILLITVLLSWHTATVMAQQPTDTIKSLMLDEVVVKAQMQSTSAAKSTYIPTARQKNSAQNAADLLRQMAITQIQIDPIDNSVTDNSGGRVAVYINYMEASKEEMEGLRTADVKRVEYLEFPTDPRFRGAERVINIFIQEYTYGGYTKITANENFLTGLSSRVNIFSKFNYKKMTYDLYAGAFNLDNHNIGKTTDGIYHLKDDQGKEYALNRKESLQYSHFRQNKYPITFQATYNDEKIQIRNLFAYSHLSEPVNEYSGKLNYTPSAMEGYAFEQRNPNWSNSLSYSGTYFFSLHKGFAIDLSPQMNYTHRNDYTSYQATSGLDIFRHAKENAYNYRVDVNMRKSFGVKHSVTIGGNGGDFINRLEYVGANGFKDRFHIAFASGSFGYEFQTKEVSIHANAGMAWEQSGINGKRDEDIYPFAYINVRYSFNRKNMLSGFFQYANNSPGISMKTSDILQENEIMYISGNPALENSRHTNTHLAYTWLPTNDVGMTTYGSFLGIYNRSILTYMPYQEGKALLRSYVNNGDYLYGEVGISVNWKLLGGKLQLHANPKLVLSKSTGIYRNRCNSFKIVAHASYYLDNFYFQGYYESPDKSMDIYSPAIERGKNFHSLTVGWANPNWNMSLMIANLFNKGWKDSTNETLSDYYQENMTMFGTTYHPRINITATYSFGYGKKVQQENEVGEQVGASSAILK